MASGGQALWPKQWRSKINRGWRLSRRRASGTAESHRTSPLRWCASKRTARRSARAVFGRYRTVIRLPGRNFRPAEQPRARSNPMAKKPTDDLFEKSTMTFGEHLEELRVCLFRGVIGIAAGCVIGFFVANAVVRFFQIPLEKAMERYYVSKALGDFKSLFGAVPVEVQRQIVEERIVPEPVQIESGQIAEALRITYPHEFGGLVMSPYWFTSGEFLSDGMPRMGEGFAASK